jgi:hypothetical protein
MHVSRRLGVERPPGKPMQAKEARFFSLEKSVKRALTPAWAGTTLAQ